MKANKFVEKFGWDKAKEVVSFTSNVCEDPTHFDSDLDIYVHSDDFKGVMDESDVCIGDLKRLIESHELIEQYNGLFEAKELIRVSPKLTSELRGLAAAIADVESCK